MTAICPVDALMHRFAARQHSHAATTEPQRPQSKAPDASHGSSAPDQTPTRGDHRRSPPKETPPSPPPPAGRQKASTPPTATSALRSFLYHDAERNAAMVEAEPNFHPISRFGCCPAIAALSADHSSSPSMRLPRFMARSTSGVPVTPGPRRLTPGSAKRTCVPGSG